MTKSTTAIVSSTELGTRCWSALRTTGHCHRCERYDRCQYPERVADSQYDALRDRAARLRAESAALFAQAKSL